MFTLCPCETPEGASIGIVKNLSLIGQITILNNSTPVIECLDELEMIPLEQAKPYEINHFVKIMVNGDWMGIHMKAQEFVNKLREMRRNGIINIYTSIAWDIKMQEVHIHTDGGRLCHPAYIVKNNDVVITDDIAEKLRKHKFEWNDLFKDHTVIEFVDTEEYNTCMVAMPYEDLRKNKKEN